jgi:hypothetical protein
MGVLAYLALTVTIPALLLGHQGQDFPPLRWWRTRHPQPAAEPQPPAARPRPVPSWAHTEPYDYDIEEAA